MTEDALSPPALPHPRQSIGPAMLTLAPAISALALAFGLWQRQADIANPPSEWLPQPDIPGLLYPVLALVAGLALALPLACLWANRGQWRRMLRYRHGRALAAVLMAGLTPIGFWGKLPAVLGFFLALGWGNLDSPEVRLAWLIPATLLPLALAWPLACGLIYGLKRRWRLLAFAAFNLGQMALAILAENVWPGSL